MSKRQRALAPAIAPSPKPSSALPKLIAIREGDATALELRIGQRNQAQQQAVAAQQKINIIVGDIASDASVSPDDIHHRYTLTPEGFVLLEAEKPAE